jgi:exodeoxyribonuclease VII large subunit
MSRRVTHDGKGVLQVRFSFDRTLVDRIKTLPNRRWNATERYWWVPESDVVLLVDLLRTESFSFDAQTRELYGLMGGTAALEAAPDLSRGPTLPGLFDEPEAQDGSSAQPRTGGDDYTVAQLNARVQAVIESAFPAPVWLVGEISGFNKNAHRRHVSFELAERTDCGETVSKISATLFEGTRREITRQLARAGDPFQLEDEVTVRMRVRVELYVPWGQYRVVVEELDVSYTLGEAARRREEIVRRLIEAGLAERNPALPLPALPLRIALITSLGSDAFNDVLRTLQESGYAFRVTAHGARVQGHATEPSVLNALDWIRERGDRFDVVLICRGGGSRTDLVWFDSEPLGRAVAEFPLPVLVGIGHEQDRSVLDAVARSCKTPTAAARSLVDRVAESVERVETCRRRILEAAELQIREGRQEGAERGRRLALASRNLLDRERTKLAHGRRRLALGLRARMTAARQLLARWSTLIPRGATTELGKQRLLLAGVLRSVRAAARRELETAGATLRRGAGSIGPLSARRVGLESERAGARARRLQLVDPRRVLERGYAILRGAGGGVLTEAGAAPSGTLVHAELKRGALNLRSEGEVPESGGERGS